MRVSRKNHNRHFGCAVLGGSTMKSWFVTIRLFPIFVVAAFLAIQVLPSLALANSPSSSTPAASPTVMGTATVAGIDIVVRKKPGGKILRATTGENGTFSVRVEGPANYQITATGVKTLKPGTSVTLSYSVRLLSVTPASGTTRESAPVSKVAVVSASGGLDFLGDIQVNESSILIGHLAVGPRR